MDESKPEGNGNQRKEVMEEVTLRDIRDEIRYHGAKIRDEIKSQTEAQWIVLGITVTVLLTVGAASGIILLESYPAVEVILWVAAFFMFLITFIVLRLLRSRRKFGVTTSRRR
jgi:uncharacterized membrane protein YoaK (UPF0700 family)